MSDLGKAIYMASSVFLFIIAATTSIYLYGTLNSYLDIQTTNTNVTNRTEGIDYINSSKVEREITRAEIYVMLFNMDQMHIDYVELANAGVYDCIVTNENVQSEVGDIVTFLDFLNNNADKKYTYSYTVDSEGNATVTYTVK